MNQVNLTTYQAIKAYEKELVPLTIEQFTMLKQKETELEIYVWFGNNWRKSSIKIINDCNLITAIAHQLYEVIETAIRLKGFETAGHARDWLSEIKTESYSTFFKND